MTGLLKIMLSLSLSGALLIGVLFLCKTLVKDKLSKRWQYYIWLVVIARLWLPFAPETNLMGTVFQQFDHAVMQADTNSRAVGKPSVLPEINYSGPYSIPGQVGDGGQLDPVKETTPSTLEIVRQNIAAGCLLVWLIGAVGLLIRKVTVYQSFAKYMRAGRIEILDMALWERVGRLVEQIGIKGAVGLYTNSLISSPLLIGFFRPCIMLPTTGLSESDFENTILHELTHYKRRDMFYKWLVQVTICVHWFNPLVYLMGREVNRACELSCDEAVIKPLDERGRRAYGDTLLNAMEAGGSYKSSLASVTLNESKELMKERLDAIMNFKSKSKLITMTALVMAALFSTGAMVVGAYANTDGRTKPSPTAHYDTTVSESELGTADLYISIMSAAVEVLPATDHKLSAKYNSEVYTVEITEQETDKWTVTIASKTGNNIGNDPVKLYLPDADYGDISLDMESASFDWEAVFSGNIVSTVSTSSVHIVLPGGFRGSFKADITDGSFELSSKDGYSDCDVTVSGNVSVPGYFKREGIFSTYSDGSKENVIEITAVGGYAEIK